MMDNKKGFSQTCQLVLMYPDTWLIIFGVVFIWFLIILSGSSASPPVPSSVCVLVNDVCVLSSVTSKSDQWLQRKG